MINIIINKYVEICFSLNFVLITIFQIKSKHNLFIKSKVIFKGVLSIQHSPSNTPLKMTFDLIKDCVLI